MTAWELPKSLNVNGKEYAIRTDFRVILDILCALNDPDLYEPDAGDQEKSLVRTELVLRILFENFDDLPPSDWQEAVDKAMEFIDCGMTDDGKKKPQSMDWEQDAPIMIPAINKALGQEVRAIPYLHWWTFFGGYMEIGESLFSQVLEIRQKKLKGKKLEKWEREFYNANKSIIDIKKKVSEEEKKEIDSILKWL